MRLGPIGTGIVSLTLSGVAVAVARAQSVPMDAQPACAISPTAFAAMFETGAVTLNGVVKPADSTVNLTPNCGFFSWSEQMFLWLTSPAPAQYGGGSRIMFSPSFYTASPPFSAPDGTRRDFIPNRPGLPIRMMLRATELGPHMLPALVSKTGQVIEVQRADPDKPVPPVVRLQNGALVRLTSVRRGPTGMLQFFGARGAKLQVRKIATPTISRQSVRLRSGKLAHIVPMEAMQTAIQARKFVIGGIPIFIDPSNTVIDVEPGQADGGVLISQNGSLIYYIIALNDVFAYSRTMRGAPIIPEPTTLTMPMTAADAVAITSFAAAHGHVIADPEALAIESKSSWIAASAVSDPGDYVVAQATVPVFDKSNPNMWVATSAQTTIPVVMVGIHVVGSTNGHGEMVWGSFEHVSNAPNASYNYSSTSGIKTVPQNTSGNWVFTPNGSTGPFNAMNARVGSSDSQIVGTPVSSTPVLRMHPWGMPGSDTTMNTQVISSTASVISQLAPGDVRRNYFQLGTTWTAGGAPPNGSNQVGTNLLANATIETFAQAQGTGTGTNCFSCHETNTTEVSHVYDMMKVLF